VRRRAPLARGDRARARVHDVPRRRRAQRRSGRSR
jgi:hypothetical protein